MAKFMLKVSYSAEGTKGLIKEGGSARRAAVAEMLAAHGGKLEGFYYDASGSTVYAISDLPDTLAATAISLAVQASGVMKVIETIALLSPEELDQATKKAVHYRSPGK